ncbi:MAG: tetratricopeptide repeat protein, partial [Myxococcota bacterium]
MAANRKPRWLFGVMLTGTLALFCTLTACEPRNPAEFAQELHNAGRYQESLEILREALAEGTQSPRIFFLYGQALRRTNQPQKAVWALREAAEHPDWMAPANLELAAALMRSADWSGAVEAMDRVLEVRPEHGTALILRGEALSQGNLDETAALEDFDRALELDPKNFRVHLLRISTLIGLERTEEAGELIAEVE